ncbi:MAG: hypothetical protein QXJ74_00065 [Nitrososphaera sp.]|uniref:hypothetical protein n=1 Tax=Nitrososphaera sp. TaxID=1971748 RepID=UPI001802E0A0|nr:hypothetical protein [Nitrososphaera sp.]NWG36429.1 hypothetical protein [Nitrososphaera sp.]
MASRAGVIAIFAMIGFAVGFFAYLASPVVGQALLALIPTLSVDPSIVFAMITGAAGALVSTVTVTAWARRA